MPTIRPFDMINASSLETKEAFYKAIAEMQTLYVALLVKLDADGGVTDTNYAALLTPTTRISGS